MSFILTVLVPAISTVPAVGASNSPMMFSKVDFPEPEVPTMEQNSPPVYHKVNAV